MFAFDRSAFAVLAPLALLVAAAWWSNRGPDVAQQVSAEREPGRVEAVAAVGDQTVAANLPSR